MEESVQRLLRLAPPWARQILSVCCLMGAGLSGVHSIFAPAIDKALPNIVDPASLTATTLSLASLIVIGPIWFAAHWLNPHRRSINNVLAAVDLVEEVMEKTNIRETERVTIRRRIARAYGEAATSGASDALRPALAAEAANAEVPGLMPIPAADGADAGKTRG